MNKRAISPVVATALLLVVAVVAVVGFQTWFNTYQSGLSTKVEQQSDSGSSATVERVETDGDLFIKNVGATNISVTTISITGDAGTCTSGNYSTTVLQAENVTTSTVSGSCSLTEDQVAKVVIVTEDGVISGEYLVR